MQRVRASWALLGVLLAADGDPAGAPCNLLGVSSEVYSGSRLLASAEDRLELLRGRRLDCASPRVSPVVTALEAALQQFPRERLEEPVRVHLDPRLPRRQAPLRGIEVHVTSREILIDEAALAGLEPAAWRHELFHTLAAAPPSSSPVARRLWLTLEESLVAHLTLAWEPRRHAAPAPPRPWPPASEQDWAELEMGSYDPHPLAELLTHELALAEPSLEASAALRCLTAPPLAASGAPETLRDSARAFVVRCPEEATGPLRSAIARWLPEPPSPLPSGALDNAAALAEESR